MSSRRNMLIAVIAALAFAVGASSVDAAFSADERKCRETLSKRGSKLAETVAKTLTGCHKKRSTGKISETTDCNSPVAADGKGKVEQAADKLVDEVTDKCADFMPGDLFYTSCPAPCDTLVPVLTDFQGVADCAVCVIENSGAKMSVNAQGRPVAPMVKDDSRCHNAIGKNQEKHFKTILKERRKCQKVAEVGGAMSTAGCGGADPDGKIGNARDKGEEALEKKCDDADLFSLDSCTGISIENLNTCVFDDSEARGELIFQALYGLMFVSTTTTTSPPGTTTTTTTTTTTIPGGAQDPLCPDRGELRIFAGVRGATCSSNTDCEIDGVQIGDCDTGLGRCVTVTQLDSGYTGFGHGSDINDDVLTEGFLLCPGPFDGGSPEPCGTCSVEGIDASNTRTCRCNYGNQEVCSTNQFELDPTDCDTGLTCSTNADCQQCSVTGGACNVDNDCPLAGTKEEICMNGFRRPTCSGGQCLGTCECIFGPPLPLTAGGTSACVVNFFREDVSGVANVDTGEGSITAKLFARVFLPQGAVAPCPYCSGDITPNDGVRDGTCVGALGTNAGRPCDVQALNESFPADLGGGGHSLDCIPGVGQNVSGEGIPIDLVQTTGAAPDLNAEIPCGFNFDPQLCPCATCQGSIEVSCQNNSDCLGTCTDGACSNLPSTSCSTNTDCDFMTCQKLGSGIPLANGCNFGDSCDPVGDGTYECSTLTSKFCDGVTLANGNAFIACTGDSQCINGDCGSVSCGLCTVTQPRKCFPDPITASGSPDPDKPVGAATFCIAPTANPGINSAAGLPGPGRVVNQAKSRTFCASNPGVQYTPGVGGCP